MLSSRIKQRHGKGSCNPMTGIAVLIGLNHFLVLEIAQNERLFVA